MEEIEKQPEQRPTKAGDASDMTATFILASKVAQLTSGESIKTSIGKIAKTIADYMNHKTTTATTNILGYVKLSDTFSSAVVNGAATNGMETTSSSCMDHEMQKEKTLRKTTGLLYLKIIVND